MLSGTLCETVMTRPPFLDQRGDQRGCVWKPPRLSSKLASSTTVEVSKHIQVDHPQHSVELGNTEVLTTEPRWFERGVKEAIYIRALNPSLNRDGGRYNLPPVWDNIIKKKVKADRLRRGGGLVITVKHSVPDNITGTSQLMKLTAVGESSCELIFYYPEY